VRREALRQWLWEKAEGWNVKQQDGALKSALLAYGFDVDPQAAIERMTEGEIETLVLHEEGELRRRPPARRAWARKLAGLCRQARRDCWPRGKGQPGRLPGDAAGPAGCRGAADSLHFWFSTFDGLRREMFPRWSRPTQKSALATRRSWPRRLRVASISPISACTCSIWTRPPLPNCRRTRPRSPCSRQASGPHSTRE
jgi:hypothetical protein